MYIMDDDSRYAGRYVLVAHDAEQMLMGRWISTVLNNTHAAGTAVTIPATGRRQRDVGGPMG